MIRLTILLGAMAFALGAQQHPHRPCLPNCRIPPDHLVQLQDGLIHDKTGRDNVTW